MEENSNLTAERSLEIITEQIAQSRRAVSKTVGQSLYIAGLCTMCVAIIIGIGFYFTCDGIFYLLYLALPFIIYWAKPDSGTSQFRGYNGGKDMGYFCYFCHFILCVCQSV